MRHSNTGNPIQGFTPSEIRDVTAMDFTGADKNIIGIRLNTESEYYINTDSANKATMPAGVTIIDSKVSAITFTASTTVEIMVE